MTIWLIEDDGYKRDKIKALLLDLFPGVHIHEAKSAKSAFRLLTQSLPSLIVLDMSLPTFDIGPEESGGRPQGFGGVEVLREMDRREVSAPVVVVTQYEVFGEERMGLNELARKLKREHPKNFVHLVYYEAATEQWKIEFKNAVEMAINRKNGGDYDRT